MRRHCRAIVVLALLVVPAAATAKTNGFQIELRGLASQPVGTLESGVRTNDLFESGGGYGARLLFGLSRNLSVGASVSYFKNRKEYGFAVALPGPPGNGVFAPRDSTGAFVGGPANRSLSTLPVEAVVQFRTYRPKSINGWAEIGFGRTATRAKVVVGAASRSAIEHMFSGSLGGGLIAAIHRDVELVGGVEWHQAWSRGNGDVWQEGDSPRFLSYALGVRYPRN